MVNPKCSAAKSRSFLGFGLLPGAVARTSTWALTNTTIRYALALADKGAKQAAREDKALALGFNVLDGHVCYKPVADAHGLPYVALQSLLG